MSSLQEIMQRVKNAGWFCPRTLMDHCQNLGLVIDLTDTFRYYNPEEFEFRGVTHLKIRVMGRKIPEEKAVLKFYQAVDNFLDKNKENEKVIGVHCTHGLNRTGYLVCRYMIQVLGIAPDQAIADFNSARGHEVERENYLTDLRQAPWMNQPIATYSKSSSSSSYRRNADLDNSAASLDSSANNTSTLDTTSSEVESPSGPSFRPGLSWNIPLLKYPRRPAGKEQTPLDPPPSRRPDTQKPLLCFRCEQPGHFARVCPNRRGDGHPDKNKPSPTPHETRSSLPNPGTNSSGGHQRFGYLPQGWGRRDNPEGAKSAAAYPPVVREPPALRPTTPRVHSPHSGKGGTDAHLERDRKQSDHQKRIKELEEVVQQQRRQIEELSRRLQTCQCGHVPAKAPPS
ncbi:uncharacterized protein LOC126987897 isoform X2 [Eriocheir sinensis]|uniref:uncharacterized protein LOC126987897 isoform X2 n=1 Tax=Eriocheir sinensis TaxID=95602 RepID=UPI0021C75FB1|nr:uncharacterized protein LOC126987897 isoform X2 [Eriocheir sinensis]